MLVAIFLPKNTPDTIDGPAVSTYIDRYSLNRFVSIAIFENATGIIIIIEMIACKHVNVMYTRNIRLIVSSLLISLLCLYGINTL